jgi:GT2 family glycosyltransferase
MAHTGVLGPYACSVPGCPRYAVLNLRHPLFDPKAPDEFYCAPCGDKALTERRKTKMANPTRPPILDIVMLVHDQAGWADLAIRAVEHHTKNPYRLILVDSASVEPKTRDMLAEAQARGHTVLRLEENRSFSSGVNAGVAVGSAQVIALLNDDALVTEGWDGALLQDCLGDKHVGLVGARSNYASGAQMDPTFNGEPPYLVFVCVALRREVWNAVGPMDSETFDGFSSEDLDYSWRVRKAGYKLKLSNAYVLHAGSRTIAAQLGGADAQIRNNRKYNERLVDKWGKEWTKRNTKLKPSILVATFHAEEWTRVSFMGALMTLRNGANGNGFQFVNQTRAPIHVARQAACDYALDNNFDYLVQLDDDALFPSDVIKRLMAHQKDVVCALAYGRKPPHWTCAFEATEDGLMGSPLEGIENTGLRKVFVSGFHCSVIHTSVIQRLRDGLKDAEGKVTVPGTRQYFGGFDNKVGEDFAFCINLKKIGVQTYVDTDLIAGHIGSAINIDESYKRDFQARQLR